ncbi:MAG TPA: uroporphyrinogen-III C-methyltransferase [Streptosporangiaceae bacterium]|nr:uroporphyrinogen-III C-methyltransferase [Streptosporangiaceae bacterium]
MPPYLLGLRLTGRRVVVVGGGRVAQRRVPALLAAGADVVLIAPEVTPALEVLPIERRPRPYRSGDCEGAWLVQACTDDPKVNAMVAAEAEARHIWCVRADDAEASAAWTPASGVVDDTRGGGGEAQGSVVVGVLAGGDPRRSAGIRDAVVEGLRDASLEARHSRKKPSGVALVGGGPGDPGLITVRGRQLLAQADVVIADRLAPRVLLDELAHDVEVIDAAKIPYGRSLAQERINDLLVERAREGRFVVRLKGGDPFVFGRGAEEVLHCARHGIPVTVVPGITSATAVPAVARVPVSHRGVAQEFHVVSAHVDPDDPDSTVDWESLGRSRGTLVLLMAVARMHRIAGTLMRYGRSSDTPVAVIQDGTLPHQRTLTATLDTVAAAMTADGVRPPAIVVVGEVVHVAREIDSLRANMGRDP